MPLTDAKYRIRQEFLADTDTLKFEIIDRESEQPIATRTYNVNEVAASLRKQIFASGVKSLLADRTSDLSFTGENIVTPAEKLDAMDAVFELFRQGIFERSRKSGGPVISLEVVALAELTGTEPGAIQQELRNYTKATRDAMYSDPRVVAKVAELKAKRANASGVLGMFGVAPDAVKDSN